MVKSAKHDPLPHTEPDPVRVKYSKNAVCHPEPFQFEKKNQRGKTSKDGQPNCKPRETFDKARGNNRGGGLE